MTHKKASMEFRPQSEVQASFTAAAAELDSLLLNAQPAMTGIEITDRSNRSGFDWAFPNFTWCYWFIQDIPRELEIERASTIIEYAEPVHPVDVAEVRVRWRAEIFREEAVSRFDKRGEFRLTLADLQSAGIAAIVLKALSLARATIG